MSVTKISLRDEVRDAVRSEWPAFRASHPRLAAVLDEEMVIAGAAEAVGEDPEYRDAMAAAEAAGFVAGSVAELVHRLVGRWMKTLI